MPGGVLIKDADGEILGAVGISGDTSDNDEAAAIAGIEAAGLCVRRRLNFNKNDRAQRPLHAAFFMKNRHKENAASGKPETAF